MQHAAFGVHLVEFHPAGLRHAPCRNIRSNKQRSRTSFLLPLVASINRSTSREVRCFRSLISANTPRQCPLPPVASARPFFPFFGVFIILSRVWPVGCPGNPHE